MMDQYGSSGANMFLTWHVFGDPSVRVFGTAEPPRITMTLPSGVPSSIEAGQAIQIPVDIQNGTETYVPGSGKLYYRFAGGAYQTTDFAPAGGTLYTATLPAASCADAPEFYLARPAVGHDGGSAR